MHISDGLKDTISIAKVLAYIDKSEEVNAQHMYDAFIFNPTSSVRRMLLQNKVIDENTRVNLPDVPPNTVVPKISEAVKAVLVSASQEAEAQGEKEVNELLVFQTLTAALESNPEAQYKIIIGSNNLQSIAATYKEDTNSALENLCVDLNELAKNNKLDPVIGREEEIALISNVLCRKKKPNPLLIGEPGVGKTAIVEALVHNIVAGKVPKQLKDKRILALQIPKVSANSGVVGALEAQMTQLIEEIKLDQNVILYIDEIHQVSGHGHGSNYIGNALANMLKAPLARGEFMCIGSTTSAEYKNSIEKDGAMCRRFQKILIDPSTESETTDIIQGISPAFEAFHKVTVDNTVYPLISKLSSRYIPSKQQPDNAVDLLDDSCVLASNSKGTVDESVVYETVAKMSGVPVMHISRSMDCSHLKDIEPNLNRQVFGQEEALHDLALTVMKGALGISDKKRPLGVFMFLGPTGVGKTESAKALARSLFGTEEALIKLDMAEVSGGFGGTRVIGAPPGFVGYSDNNNFTEKVRERPYSVVLFDEIEKSARDVYNILLQIMEEGQITDGQGRQVNFRNTVIIMTGNVGSEHYSKGTFGLSDNVAGIESNVIQSLSEKFAPEFINRIDKICLFKPLDHSIALAVAQKMLTELSDRLAEVNVEFVYDYNAAEGIVETAFKPKYGARGIRRFVDREISDLIAREMIEKKFKLRLTYEDGIFSIS